MNKEHPTIAVTPAGNGVYRLFSTFDKDSVALTAHDLLELADWIAAHSETLALEAEQQAPALGAGSIMRMLPDATGVLEYIPRQDKTV